MPRASRYHRIYWPHAAKVIALGLIGMLPHSANASSCPRELVDALPSATLIPGTEITTGQTGPAIVALDLDMAAGLRLTFDGKAKGLTICAPQGIATPDWTGKGMIEIDSLAPGRTLIRTDGRTTLRAEFLPDRGLIRATARPLPLTETPIAGQGRKAYRLTTEAPTEFDFTLTAPDAQTETSLIIQSADGQTVAQTTGPQPVTLQATLPAGNFDLFVIPRAQTEPHLHTLTTRRAPGLISWLPSYGSILSTHRDWHVARDENGSCFALTEARDLTPKSAPIWDGLPVFSLRYDKGSDAVGMSLLFRGDTTPGTAKIEVLRGGKWVLIPGRFDQQWLKPLAPGKSIVPREAIARFTRGSDLRISGTYRGTDFSFHYSLLGYSAANRAANKACNAKAGWTVR